MFLSTIIVMKTSLSNHLRVDIDRLIDQYITEHDSTASLSPSAQISATSFSFSFFRYFPRNKIHFMTYFRRLPQCLECYNLTPAKRDVTTVISDQRSRFNRVTGSTDDYNTPDTVVGAESSS